MNAVTKGVSLGIYRDGQQRGADASRTGAQPYVELMGRRSVLPHLFIPRDRQELTHILSLGCDATARTLLVFCQTN